MPPGPGRKSSPPVLGMVIIRPRSPVAVLPAASVWRRPGGARIRRAARLLLAGQGAADRIAKLVESIRLTKECLREFWMIADDYMGLVVAAGQDHRESGRQLSQRNQCLPAVHARHGQIAKYATDFIPVLPEYLHSLDAVVCQE